MLSLTQAGDRGEGGETVLKCINYALHFTSLHITSSSADSDEHKPPVGGAQHACRPNHIGKDGGAGRVATM